MAVPAKLTRTSGIEFLDPSGRPLNFHDDWDSLNGDGAQSTIRYTKWEVGIYRLP